MERSRMYKGYEIDSGMIRGKFTVFFEGDELVFDSLKKAKAFIDDMEIAYGGN